jgi:hypothetical protein
MLKRPVMKRPPSLIDLVSGSTAATTGECISVRQGGADHVHFGRTNPPTRMPTRSTGYMPTFMPRYFGPEPRPISIGIAEDRATGVRRACARWNFGGAKPTVGLAPLSAPAGPRTGVWRSKAIANAGPPGRFACGAQACDPALPVVPKRDSVGK